MNQSLATAFNDHLIDMEIESDESDEEEYWHSVEQERMKEEYWHLVEQLELEYGANQLMIISYF